MALALSEVEPQNYRRRDTILSTSFRRMHQRDNTSFRFGASLVHKRLKWRRTEMQLCKSTRAKRGTHAQNTVTGETTLQAWWWRTGKSRGLELARRAGSIRDVPRSGSTRCPHVQGVHACAWRRSTCTYGAGALRRVCACSAKCTLQLQPPTQLMITTLKAQIFVQILL